MTPAFLCRPSLYLMVSTAGIASILLVWHTLKQNSEYVLFVQSLSHAQLLTSPWKVAFQAPLVHEIFQAQILEWVAFSYPADHQKSKEYIWRRYSYGLLLRLSKYLRAYFSVCYSSLSLNEVLLLVCSKTESKLVTRILLDVTCVYFSL